MNKHTLRHMNSGSEMSIIVYQYIFHVFFHQKYGLLLNKSWTEPIMHGLMTNVSDFFRILGLFYMYQIWTGPVKAELRNK